MTQSPQPTIASEAPEASATTRPATTPAPAEGTTPTAQATPTSEKPQATPQAATETSNDRGVPCSRACRKTS